MATTVGKSQTLVTNGLVFAIDGNDSATFPGKGSSSTTYGDLIGQNDGTLTGGAAHRYHKNGIMDYDGTDDYITIPGSVASAISGGSFSIGIWVRLNNATTTSGGGGGTEPIIAFNNGTSARTCLSISRTGTTGAGTTSGEDERLGMFFFGDDLVASTTQVSTIMGTKWTYVVGTFDSSSNTQTLYINGSQHSTRTSSGAPNIGSTTGNIGRNDIYTRLGGSYTESDNPKLEGQTGPVHIYKRVLTTAEITQNYNLWKTRFQDSSGDGTDAGYTINTLDRTDLTAEFDAGSPISFPAKGGSTVTDLSSGDYDSTLSNATWSSDFGGYWNFDGNGDSINIYDQDYARFRQSSSDSNATDFTILNWVYVHDDASSWRTGNPGYNSGTWWSTLREVSAPTRTTGFCLAWDANNKFKMQIGEGGYGNGYSYTTANDTFSKSQWTHVAITIKDANTSSKTAVCYINGAASSLTTNGDENAIEYVYNGTNQIRLGTMDLVEGQGFYSGSHRYNYFKGRIGYVANFRRVLSAAEVLNHYNTSKSRFGL